MDLLTEYLTRHKIINSNVQVEVTEALHIRVIEYHPRDRDLWPIFFKTYFRIDASVPANKSDMLDQQNRVFSAYPSLKLIWDRWRESAVLPSTDAGLIQI